MRVIQLSSRSTEIADVWADPGSPPKLTASGTGPVQLFATLSGLRKPTSEEWCRLVEYLTVGDESTDQLVEWMCAAGIKQTRPLFDRVIADSIANVPGAPVPLHGFFE